MVDFGFQGESGDQPVVLMGDVVAHRAAPDWPQRLGVLHETVQRLATDDPHRAPLALSAGDQVVGFFAARPDRTVETVARLSEAIHPLRFVFGLGRGALTTRPDLDLPLLDGPCFHRARAALERAAKEGGLIADGFGAPADTAISALFRLVDAIRLRWTETQLRYARAVRAGALRKDVAASFGVSPSVVTESLQAASWAAVRQGEAAAAELLAVFRP
jgi:hypothetical protein